MQTTTSRRGLLKAAPLAAAAIAIPATVAAAPIPDRSEWEAAMAAFQRLRAEDQAFTPSYLALSEQCRAECDKVPHVELGADPHRGYYGPVSTANRSYVYEARRDVAKLDAGKMRFDPLPGLQEHERVMREVVRAADERDAAVQAVRDRFGMDEADERSEALTDQWSEARDALMDMPAPDLAALRWKLEQLPEPDGEMAAWSAAFIRQTFADIARLLPEGA